MLVVRKGSLGGTAGSPTKGGEVVESDMGVDLDIRGSKLFVKSWRMVDIVLR